MFRRCREEEECDFYDRILKSWAAQTEKDSTIWLAQSILSLLQEDRNRLPINRNNWNKILSNCFVIMLALTSTSELYKNDIDEFSRLIKKQQLQILDVFVNDFD